MSSITLLRRKALEQFVKIRSLTPPSTFSFRRYSQSEELDEEESSFSEAEEEARLQQLQDVSGLPLKYQQHYHGKVVEPPFKDLERRRKFYTMYGSGSGEDPRLLWPSREEIAKMQQEDREEETSLQDKLQLLKQEREDALKAKLERHKVIEKNMSQMKKWISEYHHKVESAEIEIKKRKEKKEALLDEAREYFGYSIKANDPKFEQMVEEKQEKERKAAKELKKKEKERKLAERMRQDVLAMKLNTVEESKEEKS